MLCRDQAAQLRRDYPRFLDRGLAIVVIGNGSVAEAAGFRASMDLPFPVLADPKRRRYAHFGLAAAGWRQFLRADVIHAYLGAFRRGARPGWLRGSARQLPGSFVVDRAGIVRFARPAVHPGDTATTEELLAAVSRHTERREE